MIVFFSKSVGIKLLLTVAAYNIAFHMKNLHACARHVDEDEHADILQVETHLVGDDAAQRVEVLAYGRRMRIQEEPVGVRQAEHPLSPYCYQLAERLCGDLSRQADSHVFGGMCRASKGNQEEKTT